MFYLKILKVRLLGYNMFRGNKRSHAGCSHLFLMNKNKRGWIRILEATVSVLIVTGVLIFVYSKNVDKGLEPADYFYSLQKQILSDISMNSSLRLNVLNADDNNPDEGNYKILNDFVRDEILDFVGFYISICDLDSDEDFCKMNSETYIATREKDVFVKDIIVSAELGVGENAKYNPRTLRLYMWEK